jgi:hypothetical protein
MKKEKNELERLGYKDAKKITGLNISKTIIFV